MEIWYALCIPVCFTALAYFIYHHKITVWELFLAPIASMILIVASYHSMKYATLKDVEYNGYMVNQARYYESYETWVDKTCSFTTTCCCDSKGNNCQTQTHYYDCSYCDQTAERFSMYDDGGHEISVSREKYEALLKRWKSTPEFMELSRNINKYGGCGRDGDAYSIVWDGRIESSVASTYEVAFSNILKCNHSAFNFPVITVETAKEKGLYDYPEISGYEDQNAILGINHVSVANRELFQTKMKYVNAKLGKKYKVRIFTLLFVDKSIDQSFLQEAFWEGGNQNEIIVCIGTDTRGKINWVRPFSWADDKRVVVEIRENIMENPYLDADRLVAIYENSVKSYWHYKSFADFNYLSFEPTAGQLLLVYISTIILSIGCIWWCIRNQHNSKF